MQKQSQELRTGWFMKEHGSESAWLPVKQVPSEVHLDLLANDKIPDPFLDANELAVQWIAEKDWVYKTTFNTPPSTQREGEETSNNVKTDLVFHGLDTFATVALNGRTILSSNNMHTRYRVDISHHLLDKSPNILEITFHSSLLRGRELITAHPEHTFHVRQTEASRVPVRKAQYHWGWDWGPILMSAGLWRPVVLETYTARVGDVWVVYELEEGLGRCVGEICARVEGVDSGDVAGVLSIESEEGNEEIVSERVQMVGSALVDGVIRVPFVIDSPSLWYPRGYGPQARYRLSATILRTDGTKTRELDCMTKLIGLRRTALIQEPDAHGKSFYFRINGIDIFAGGSCWIPPDSFLSRMTRDRYAEWLYLIAESNQAMVRVWGGGIYEDEAFLDAADELGILVWHDFAFACASYPVFDEFVASLEIEVRQNIRRMRSHPSVVIWAGNNEDYQVQERYKLEYDPQDTDPESWRRSTFPARYIYEYLLPKWLREEDPSAIYHPGSPWGDGKHSSDPTVGDIHQWNIWHGQMAPYQAAASLSGRFISEFGMEAYPHLSTLQNCITDPTQHHPGSLMLDFRNKATGHERRLLTYLTENFPLLSTCSDLASFTHATQILQSETMRYAYKAWRRMWGTPGARRCGGVLVWQMNDCWPTVSWAVVDYHGVRKPAFYAIKRALRGVDVGVERGGGVDWTEGHADPYRALGCVGAGEDGFNMWVASSRAESVQVEVLVRFISVASGEEVAERAVKRVTADANSTTEVFSNELVRLHLHSPSTHSPESCDPYIIHAVLRTQDGELLATDTDWPQPLKYLSFPNRNAKVHVSPSGDSITVSADRPVKGFVFEEHEGLTLSDNGFDLVPGEEQVVTVTRGSVTKEALKWTYIGAERRRS